MKQDFLFLLLPAAAVFLIVATIWVIVGISSINLILLLIGLIIGTIFLDLDYLIYWLYRKPNTEESRLVKTAIDKKDFKSVYRLIKAARKHHNNLIFHHYFFQIGIAFISLFIFSSSPNVFFLGFLMAINTHLLADEIKDFNTNPKFLQDWLFAREEKQLPIKSLKNYIISFVIFFFILLFLLVKSKT